MKARLRDLLYRRIYDETFVNWYEGCIRTQREMDPWIRDYIGLSGIPTCRRLLNPRNVAKPYSLKQLDLQDG